MIARTLTGMLSLRAFWPPLAFATLAVLAAFILAVGLGLGREAATAFEGEEVTVGPAPVPDSAGSDPAPVVEPDHGASPLTPEPTATTPATQAPPGEVPASDPAAGLEPTPPASPAETQPGTTEESFPTPTPMAGGADLVDGPDDALRAAAESTAIEVGLCQPSPGSDDVIDQGGIGIFGCAATITVVPVPAAFTEIVLDWGVIAEVTPGWVVELRAAGGAGDGAGESWVSGASPGMSGIVRLGASDDVDGDPFDDGFSYEVRFDVRLTAPACGGPVEPDVTLAPSVLPEIDGIPGWRRYGELFRQLRPSLAVAAPAPALRRTATGDLDNADDPPRFSHTDQTLDAGSLELTVTSGYCGGWNASISATDFLLEGGGATFGAGNLTVASVAAGAGSPAPTIGSVSLGNASQPIVWSTGRPLPAGTYAYTLDLSLRVPGGTPPGTYTSTLMVTTVAAP